MSDNGSTPPDPPPYTDRIAVLPGDPRIAYRPGRVLATGDAARAALEELTGATAEPIFDELDDEELEWLGRWFSVDGDFHPPAIVDAMTQRGHTAQLDIVYFANEACCGVCPPHPALAAEIAANPWGANPWGANPWGANPWGANPWGANPWGANPWGANPWGANPWGANPEQLNIVATGRPPQSTAMPAPDRALTLREKYADADEIVIGILDSGVAGGPDNADSLRPDLLGTDAAALDRISGELDVPSWPPGGTGQGPERYLDPVAGHGTFIAGLIEQITPGCTMRLPRVYHPQGDVSVSTLGPALRTLLRTERPAIVNLSFGGTGTVDGGLFERLIRKYHHRDDVVFVASAGNEGSCVEQYPAALREVIGVGALAPTGAAPWSNYGPWVNACAPGTDLVSSFFADFDGALPPENGLDPDNFVQWATWSGTSFAAPVVVAALAREIATTGCSAKDAVERVVNAAHLARYPALGTIVNY